MLYCSASTESQTYKLSHNKRNNQWRKKKVTTYKGIYPEYIIKISYNSVTKYNVIKSWTKVLNRHFSKEDIKIASMHMKRSEAPEYGLI